MSSVCVMRVDQPQELRKSRLRELLDHQDFGGNKAELGRALGYKNGAHVYQMLDGRRPRGGFFTPGMGAHSKCRKKE